MSEDAFEKLLTEAASLPRRAAAMNPISGPVSAEDYPTNTVEWLRVSGDKQFLAALALLSDRDLAVAAEPLVRSLIECHGRIAWIYDAAGDPDAAKRTRRCRSLCLELGIAKNHQLTLSKLTTPSRRRESLRTGSDEAVQRFRRLHSAEGCHCKGRTETGVSNTLRALAISAQDTWAFDAWVVTSAASHHFQPVGGLPLVAVSRDTHYVGGPAPLGRRAAWLAVLLHQWGSATARVLAIHGVDGQQQQPLHEWLFAMSQDDNMTSLLGA